MKPSDELLHLCRAITNDGEISGEEIWMLAKWMNEHPDACEGWPGEMICAVLSQVFEDGELQEAELHRVISCLQEVEVESAEYCAEEPIESSDQDVVPSIHDLPTLPSARIVVSMACSTEVQDYTVDLCEHTCTCEDFVTRRSMHPPGHIKRMCIHVAMALLQHKSELNYDGLLGAYIESSVKRGRGSDPDADYVCVNLDSGPAMLSYGSGEWVDVFAPTKGGWSRFTFSLIDQRWSFGQSPHGSRSLRTLIDAKWTLKPAQVV